MSNGNEKVKNALWLSLLYALSLLAFLCLLLLVLFIFKESRPLLQEVGLVDFLTGKRWMPIAYGGEVSFGILPFLLSSLMVSALAVGLALFWSVGVALFFSLCVGERTRSLLFPLIDLLAAVPSVVYGFLGMAWLLPLMKQVYSGSGHSVLSAAIVLSVMLLPFLISTISFSINRNKELYLPAAEALGIPRWVAARNILLLASQSGILLALILAIGRAMGETMAVMMLIGNAKVLPTILGKGETIAALIALEMGSAEVGSLHYHALFAAGMVLMLCSFLINAIIMAWRKRLLAKEGRR